MCVEQRLKGILCVVCMGLFNERRVRVLVSKKNGFIMRDCERIVEIFALKMTTFSIFIAAHRIEPS